MNKQTLENQIDVCYQLCKAHPEDEILQGNLTAMENLYHAVTDQFYLPSPRAILQQDPEDFEDDCPNFIRGYN